MGAAASEIFLKAAWEDAYEKLSDMEGKKATGWFSALALHQEFEGRCHPAVAVWLDATICL
jgi:hypothetical protein